MMRSKPDEIRKRIANRKRTRDRNEKVVPNRSIWPSEDEKHGFNHLSTFEAGPGGDDHPLFQKEVFLFKLLASACLFLLIAIMFRNHSAVFDPARDIVKKSMDKEFQFAAVSEWYEGKFGKPLALLPLTEKEKGKSGGNEETEQEYALPASGRILENFAKDGQGIMIETEKGKPVTTMNEGIVRFAGVKEGLGKTVIIQHSDKSESWYGNLEAINVKLYEYIDKGKGVGTATVSSGEDKTKGEFFFAIKKGEDFIDPVPVIRFE